MELYKILFRSYNLSFVLGGVLIGLLLGKVMLNSQPSTILYVSQQEILDLEKYRVSNLASPDDKQLFYGKPQKAVELIESITQSYSGNKAQEKHNIVFSNDKLYGKNVRSISKEVYEQVIIELKELNASN